MIALIDYGMGNLHSVHKALQHVGLDVKITSSRQDIIDSAGIVLPGVGAFPAAMNNLRSLDITETLISEIVRGKPYLGICLGLQLLFSRGDEGGGAEGLNLFSGEVVRFRSNVKIPHMGWNQLQIKKQTDHFSNIQGGSFFYFVHSYYVCPEDKTIIAAETFYGEDFCSAVARDNIFAVQFHPEKSQKAGLRMLANFGKLCR
ncbi:MAG: imidazole glycerol phosphate synthase subunit HisH [bacterium]